MNNTEVKVMKKNSLGRQRESSGSVIKNQYSVQVYSVCGEGGGGAECSV